jgi:hypothetical protein
MPDKLSTNNNPDRHRLRTAWKTVASAQGLVCLVCREVPAFEHRAKFYDTGLCAACAENLAEEPA